MTNAAIPEHVFAAQIAIERDRLHSEGKAASEAAVRLRAYETLNAIRARGGSFDSVIAARDSRRATALHSLVQGYKKAHFKDRNDTRDSLIETFERARLRDIAKLTEARISKFREENGRSPTSEETRMLEEQVKGLHPQFATGELTRKAYQIMRAEYMHLLESPNEEELHERALAELQSKRPWLLSDILAPVAIAGRSAPQPQRAAREAATAPATEALGARVAETLGKAARAAIDKDVPERLREVAYRAALMLDTDAERAAERELPTLARIERLEARAAATLARAGVVMKGSR